MVQFAMCLMLNRTRMLKPDLPFSAAVRPQMHIYGQLRLKITGLGGFEKRMSRPVMQVLEFRRGKLGRAALNVWYVRPELLDSVGLATTSQSSCLTTPRAKSMHSRCIAPVSARTRMRTSRWWATFPTWPKSANMPSIFGLTSGLTSGCGLTLLDCALSRRAPLFLQIEQALHVGFLHGRAS